MTVSIHGTLILGLGDSARLRTEIGEVSVAREAFAGVPAGEHEGDFVIRRLYLKAATGDGYVLVLPWAELADHTLASAEAHARRPTRGRTQRPSPSPGRRLREGRPAFIVRHRRLPAAGSEARRPFVRSVRARGFVRFEHPVKANRQVIPEG